jgi:hypothetical protein
LTFYGKGTMVRKGRRRSRVFGLLLKKQQAIYPADLKKALGETEGI